MASSTATLASAPTDKFVEIKLTDDKIEDDIVNTGDWEVVEKADTKHAEMTLPLSSPYIEEKEWDEIKILERQTKSRIDTEDWQIASFGGRKEKHTILKRLQEAEEAIMEELANLAQKVKDFVDPPEDEEKTFMELDERKEAIHRAREIVDASMDE